MIPQKFTPTDVLEDRFLSLFEEVMTALELDRNNFYTNAYSAQPLGSVLADLDRDPIAKVLTREVYIQSFVAIHELFTRPGTAEYYLLLFRKIWGDSVVITFTIPDPGVLEINIEAVEAITYLFMARRIVDNEYIYDEVIDDEGDNIVFQGTIGIKTQAETDALIREISPINIFTTATLVIS